MVVFLIGSALIAACGLGESSDAIATITARGLHERLQQADQPKPLVVDVREPVEFEAGHIDGALLAPLGTVHEGVKAVEKDREIVLVCRSGRRSAKAYKVLSERGYTNLRNMEGGMLEWQKLGYPVSKK